MFDNNKIKQKHQIMKEKSPQEAFSSSSARSLSDLTFKELKGGYSSPAIVLVNINIFVLVFDNFLGKLIFPCHSHNEYQPQKRYHNPKQITAPITFRFAVFYPLFLSRLLDKRNRKTGNCQTFLFFFWMRK